MLVMGTGTVGLIIARNFSLRPQQLRHLKSALQMLETEVLFGLTPLPLGLQRVGKKMAFPINKLFEITGDYLNRGEGLTAGEAWEIALKELEQESALLVF
jgi:stage III sporulation protein AB